MPKNGKNKRKSCTVRRKERKLKKKVFSIDELKAKKRISVVIQGKDIEALENQGLKLKDQNTIRDVEDWIRKEIGLEIRTKKTASKKNELCEKLGLDPEKVSAKDIYEKAAEILEKL